MFPLKQFGSKILHTYDEIYIFFFFFCGVRLGHVHINDFIGKYQSDVEIGS